ncbi:hypothetical protein N665_0128s0027 [Sinapis alba]|nr:hypothetical protein N665_0128s0027 [Sinapis alba]
MAASCCVFGPCVLGRLVLCVCMVAFCWAFLHLVVPMLGLLYHIVLDFVSYWALFH